jgi:hypothetical protein
MTSLKYPGRREYFLNPFHKKTAAIYSEQIAAVVKQTSPFRKGNLKLLHHKDTCYTSHLNCSQSIPYL